MFSNHFFSYTTNVAKETSGITDFLFEVLIHGQDPALNAHACGISGRIFIILLLYSLRFYNTFFSEGVIDKYVRHTMDMAIFHERASFKLINVICIWYMPYIYLYVHIYIIRVLQLFKAIVGICLFCTSY